MSRLELNPFPGDRPPTAKEVLSEAGRAAVLQFKLDILYDKIRDQVMDDDIYSYLAGGNGYLSLEFDRRSYLYLLGRHNPRDEARLVTITAKSSVREAILERGGDPDELGVALRKDEENPYKMSIIIRRIEADPGAEAYLD